MTLNKTDKNSLCRLAWSMAGWLSWAAGAFLFVQGWLVWIAVCLVVLGFYLFYRAGR